MVTVYKPTGGNIDNPLSSGRNSNLICSCGSKKKLKKCCGRHTFVDRVTSLNLLAKLILENQGLVKYDKKYKFNPISLLPKEVPTTGISEEYLSRYMLDTSHVADSKIYNDCMKLAKHLITTNSLENMEAQS